MVDRSLTGGGRAPVVAASGLLHHTFALDGVAFPAGQVEYVATDADHRRMGLVRAQFAEHHRRAHERGMLALIIGGIPYLYRRFGYGYGLDHPPIRALTATTWPPEAAPAGRVGRAADPAVRVRRAQPADRDALESLDEHRPIERLAVVDDRAARDLRWATCASDRWERLRVLERDGRLVGWFRTQHKPEDGRLYVIDSAIDPAEPASTTEALLSDAVAGAGDDLTIVYEIAGSTLERHLAELAGAGTLPDRYHHDHGIYVRVPDPARLLDALRPALSRRLEAAGRPRAPRTLVVSLYGSGVALDLAPGSVEAVRRVEGIEDPHASGDVGVAPDWFGALVFGRWGAVGLAERADDVTLGRHRDLMEVLFPPRPSDVVGAL